MRISSVNNINQNKIYPHKTPVFQARFHTEEIKTLGLSLPKFINSGVRDKLRLLNPFLKLQIAGEIKNQYTKLKELNLVKYDRECLFDFISDAKDPKTYLQVLKSLTGKGTPKKVSYDFLASRLFCSFSSWSGEFSQEKYDYFNELAELCKDHEDCKKYPDKNILADLSILVSRAYDFDKVEKNIVNYTKKWLPTKGPCDVEYGFNHFGAELSNSFYELGIKNLKGLAYEGDSLGIASESACWILFKDLYKHFADEHYTYRQVLALSKLCVNKRNEIIPENVDYIKNNKEQIPLIITHSTNCLNIDNGKIDPARIRLIKLFGELELDCTFYINEYLDKFPFNVYSEEPIKLLQEVKDEISGTEAVDLVRAVTDDDGEVDRDLYESIMRVREFAKQNKELLREGNNEITDEDIDKLLLCNPERTARTLSILGEKTFIYSFKDKYSEVYDYLDLFGDCDIDWAEDLIEIINPQNDSMYKESVEKIKYYKDMLKSADNSNRADIINNINEYTKIKNDIMRESVKDPKEALELAIITKSIYDNAPEKIWYQFRAIMNPRTDEEKQVFDSFLNSSILEVMNINGDYPPQVLAKIDFSKNKYLHQLFKSDEDFSDEFKELLDILAKYPNKNNLEIFNNLEQNKETQKQFKKLGLNYANWVKFNPDSNIHVNLDLSLEQVKESAYRNFEADLNDDLFILLPEEEKNKLIKRLADAGFKMDITNLVSYDADGFVSYERPFNRLFKGGELIKFDDLKQVIDVFKSEMNENEFWTTRHSDDSINSRKENFKYHILHLRYNEVKNARDKKSAQNLDLVVQKADMNDIQHALFLGNDAGCCTAVNGSNGWSAVTYIKNKLISAIEIKDGDKYIGNTMCYIAFVDGKLALVLDNIELKSKYQYNDKIRDAIFAYAKELCAEIGKPDMPIYAGPNRHKVNMDGFDFDVCKMQIVGSTGEDEIYLDYDAERHQINGDDGENVKMYRIR